jgi:PAS domain S-box-containing protein
VTTTEARTDATADPLQPETGAQKLGDGFAGADLAAVLDSIGDPVALIGTDGALRTANSAYHDLMRRMGLSDGPISAGSATAPRDRSGRPVRQQERAFTRALEGRSTRAERVLRMVDGSDRVFALNANPLRDADGAVVGMAIVLRDITDQSERERSLRILNEVRRGLSLAGDVRRAARSVCRRSVSLLPYADMAIVYMLDGDDLIYLAQAGFSGRAARMLPSLPIGPGHRSVQAVRENRTVVFIVDKDEPASEASRRFITAGGAVSFINLPLAAGTHPFGLLVLVSKEPHEPSADELALAEALAAQVGAELEGIRRREEAETERSRLQAVLDQLPEGVLMFDAAGRLAMSNRSAEQILGQPVDASTPVFAMAARYGVVRADGRSYQVGETPLARTFATGQPVLGEEQIVRRGDSRELPIVSNVAPVRTATGELAAVIMVFQDITSLREMDRQKDEFISVAGHELRTPITSIRGLAQLLHQRFDRLDRATVLDALKSINEQTDQMALLVDDLLDVSRIRTDRLALDVQPCDLTALVRAAVERIRLHHDATVALSAQPGVVVRGDPRRLAQVVNNLLDNAVKYSPRRAAIDVDLAVRRNNAILTIRDRGIGVPEEALPRLFERFYRAPNAIEFAGGLGLGLYICQEIVERHGGQIRAKRNDDVGTTFTVELPVDVDVHHRA